MANPAAGNAEAAVKNATESIAMLRKIKPRDDFEARSLSTQILRATELMVEASKAATAEATVKRVANGGNGHANGRRGVVATDLSDGVVKALAAGMVPFLKQSIADATAPLLARIAELEARRGLSYEGSWDPERRYVPGQFITQDGNLWHCERECVGVCPPAETWVLAVRKGRDGRSR